MSHSPPDERSAARKAQDEEIAAQPQLPPLNPPAETAAVPVEHHLCRQKKRPLAVAGVVENGVVRPLDPDFELPENTRVIIVTSEATAAGS